MIRTTEQETKTSNTEQKQENNYIEGVILCIEEHLDIYKAIQYELMQNNAFVSEANYKMELIEKLYKQEMKKSILFEPTSFKVNLYAKALIECEQVKKNANEIMKNKFCTLQKIDLSIFERSAKTKSEEFAAIGDFRFQLERFGDLIFNTQKGTVDRNVRLLGRYKYWNRRTDEDALHSWLAAETIELKQDLFERSIELLKCLDELKSEKLIKLVGNL